MDWIHCNDCYKQPYTSPSTAFVLTSCARIQCSACNASNSCVNKECKPCRSQNYSAVKLDESLPAAVEDFFRDPLDHLKKFLKVYDFQKCHRERLLKHQNEKHNQMAAQTSQLLKTNTDLQSQMQKYKSETQDAKEENTALRSKIQELESLLANERRPTTTEIYRNHMGGSTDPKKRPGPAPSVDRGPSDRSIISWQTKVPDPPVRTGDPLRQRRFLTTQQELPHKSRVTQQFLNPETPAYFPSYSVTPSAMAKSSNLITPRKHSISLFPTLDVYRQRQSVPAPVNPQTTFAIPAKPRQQQPQQQQQQKRGLPYGHRVYAFMSEAARQALTPEASK